MADYRELLARAGVRTVPGTVVSSWGEQRFPQRPQPQAQQPQPVAQGTPDFEAALAALKQSQGVSAPQPEQEEQAGTWKQVLGSVAKPLEIPLKVLGYGGAAVTSTLKEGLDVVGEPLAKGVEDVLAPIGLASRTDWENDNPYDGGFDIGDALQNTKDLKGFGEQIVEPVMGEGGTDRDIWVRRVAGFSGDVAADPLRFLTLGATTAAGGAGRRTLAAEAYAKGMSDDVIERAARGASHLSDAERSALGIEQAGFYLGNKHGAVRLPGSKTVANVVGKGMSNARMAVQRRRPWQSINFDPKGIEEAAAALRGAPSRLSMTQAAAIVDWDQTRRATQKTFIEPAAREAHGIVGKIDERTAIQMTHAIEAGVDNPQVAPLREFMRKLRTEAEGDIALGDLGDNYMPHMWTDAGQKLLDNGSPLGNDLAKLVSGSKGRGVVLKRELKAGTYEIGGKRVTFKTGTIDDINRTLNREFPELNGAKLLEDDARHLVSMYINSLGSNLGKVKGFQHLLSRPGGVAAKLDDVADEVIQEFSDNTANKAAREAADEVLKARRSAYQKESAQAKVLSTKLQRELVDQLQNMLDEASAVEGPLKETLQALAKQGKDLNSARAEIGKRVTAMKAQAAKKVKALEKEFLDLEKRVEAEQIRMAAAEAAGKPPIEAQMRALAQWQGRMTELQATITAGRKAQQEVDQIGAMIGTLAAASKRLTDVAADPDEVSAFAALIAENPYSRAALDAKRAEADRVAQELAAAQKAQPQANRKVASGVKAQAAAEQLPTPAETLGVDAPREQAAQSAKTIADAAARQGEVSDQVDMLDAVLRRTDAAAADEIAKVDAAKQAIDLKVADTKKGIEEAQKRVAETRRKLRSVAERNPKNAKQMRDLANEMDAVIKELPNSPELTPVVALQAQYAESLAKLGSMKSEMEFVETFRKAASDGDLYKVYVTNARKGWTEVMGGLLPEGQRIAIQDEVDRAMSNLIEADPAEVWKAIDKMTQFFKSYATATPGFHLRNAMGAVFSNMADGATTKNHLDALREWAAYKKDPFGHLKKVQAEDPKLFAAWQATLGSGAGGAYVTEELGKGTGFIMNNRLLKAMHKIGSDIEGPARLALAMRSAVDEGQSMAMAMQRVSRLQVDYSQLSKTDVAMKRVLPFWMFMSRNLPAQISQMMLKPKAYSAYARLHQQATEANGFEGMPVWLEDQMALPIGTDDEGNQKVLKPDLPFLGMSQDAGTLDPRNPLRAISNMNPLISAPLEAAAGRDFYFDRPLEGSDRILDPLSAIVAPIAQARRLSATGPYEGKGKEKWTNYLGIPYQEISPEQIQREMFFRARDGR